MLHVDYMVLADAAVASEGKHYIHGAGWDSLYAINVPVVHPAMAVAVRLRVSWNDTNQPHRLELDVVDSDGNTILAGPPHQGDINVGRPPTMVPGQDQVVTLAFTLLGMQFSRYGMYEVVIRINGTDQARSPFNVTPPPGIRIP